MSFNNPYTDSIRSLADVRLLSTMGNVAVDIVEEHMTLDPGHDEMHLVRVVRNALWFGEGGDRDVIIPAAILHDLVNYPKDDPRRSRASLHSADLACKLLNKYCGYNNSHQENQIAHVIEAHSWSAGITPTTLEAKAVQDADRIDALGYLGIVRLFTVNGSLGRAIMHSTDPLAIHRRLDDSKYGLDHFACKLSKLYKTMQTEKGRQIALQLTLDMVDFIHLLLEEINVVEVHTSMGESLYKKILEFSGISDQDVGHDNRCRNIRPQLNFTAVK